jgi:RimJ/RimL family protein N-acetyltransferase
MDNWVPDDTKLDCENVGLIPLEPKHFDDLFSLAADKRIWEFYAVDFSNKEKLNDSLNMAIADREAGIQFPFVIINKANGKIIGSTRFLDIQPNHRKLEIGATWLSLEYWATAINPDCKLLLLEFCFEKLEAIRVQLKTDENNLRSRKAIQKIGCKFEGILRQDTIRDNGTYRSSAFYSILDNEWKATKAMLLKMKV